MTVTMLIEPFRIATDPLVLADLRSRLASVRLSDAVVDDWSYGTSPAALRELVARWGAYDWLAREAELNALPQYRANVDGSGVHFVHVRGVGPAPRPLLLASGWPSSFVEYLPIVNQLANPGAYGGDPRDAFHVVIPAMPGYGFSDRPVSPKAVRAVDLYKTLMTEGLGYATFAVAGSDIGTGVATRLALYYADSVSAIHICGTAPPPLERRTAPHSEAERIYLAARERWEREEGAYAAIASTRPQTLAFALADSPAGLASWIVEKFHAWSDRRERGNFWRRATRQSYALLDHGNHRHPRCGSITNPDAGRNRSLRATSCRFRPPSLSYRAISSNRRASGPSDCTTSSATSWQSEAVISRRSRFRRYTVPSCKPHFITS